MCYTICLKYGGRVNPRLLVIAGPLRDRTILLHSAEIPVGRDPGNVVAISDPSLSRRHCALVRDDAGYSIRDLESRNGTFVNGVAVTESRLQHGDQVSVGDSVFVFLVREEVEEPASHVEFEEGTTHATAQIRPQDVLYFQPDKILSELPATSRLARNLSSASVTFPSSVCFACRRCCVFSISESLSRI